MEITKILSGMQNQASAPVNNSASSVQAASLTQAPPTQAQPILSSKYTYAMGNDGKRYVLQLRIDIARLGGVSELA